ncbi:MAG: hemolysin family protein [Chloroflexota bacterium]|nr:hemolysin family protein [Chloroflexota bacterium]
MDNVWQHVVLAVLALLVMCLAAIVQSTIGLTSAQRIRQFAPVQREARDDAPRHRTVQSLVDPRRILAASMILLQVLMAILATGELIRAFEGATDDSLQWLAMLIVAVVFIVFGLALPRAIAAKQMDRFLGAVLRLGHLATVLLVPLNWLVEKVALGFSRILPGDDVEQDNVALEEELRPHRIERDDEVIGADEQEMINGILSLEEMTVRDIMVPRLDIVAVDRTVNPRELIDTIVKAGHSRIPVYQESVDRIIGVLYAKDLLPFVIGNTIRIPLLDLIRPAFVVPESKRLNLLFAELRRTKIHLAIVADEYGGTAGLVTIEDILEEIVGEIQDEYDTDDWLFDQPAVDKLLADGRLPIEDVEDALRIQFEDDDDFGTLGGFVHKHLGRLPIQGDAFEAEGVRVEIQAVERHRVRKLLLTKLPPAEPETEKSPERSSRWGRTDATETDADGESHGQTDE